MGVVRLRGHLYAPICLDATCMFWCTLVWLDTPMCSDTPYIQIPPICSDAPYVWTPQNAQRSSICSDPLICLDAPYTFVHPHMFGCPHPFGCPSVCLNTPTHLYAPCAPMYICMFLGASVYDMGMGASIQSILSAWMLLQG